MTVVCAWCAQVMATGGETVTHGICPLCAKKFDATVLRTLRRHREPKARRARRYSPRAGAPLPGFDFALQA